MLARGLRPTLCLQCGESLKQPATGRRRMVCAARECQRAAAAERGRIRRRERAGIPVSPYMDAADPAPRGGRDPLAVRLAKQLATREWPARVLSAEEVQMLTAAVRAGAGSRFSLECLANGKPVPGVPASPLPDQARGILLRLLAEPPPAPVRRLPEVRELEDVTSDAGLVLDPRTGAWVRRR